MKLAWTQSEHNGEAEWSNRKLLSWLKLVIEKPSLRIRKGATQEVRQHVREQFENQGWAINVRIDGDSDLSVFALKDDLAVHLQTGNMSRAAYDLLKLQYLYASKRIEAAALILPTKAAAQEFGSNVAHADRVGAELKLFSRVVSVPILLVAFE